jgi:hypothetical protein
MALEIIGSRKVLLLYLYLNMWTTREKELSRRSAGGFDGSQPVAGAAAIVANGEPADGLRLQRRNPHGHGNKRQWSGVAQSAAVLVRVLMGMFLSERDGLRADHRAQHDRDA